MKNYTNSLTNASATVNTASKSSAITSGSAGSSANTASRLLAQGRLAPNDDLHSGLNNNDLIIGGSGTGKTGGYVIPNLHRIPGSVITADTKGQLHRMFKDELRASGYQVQLLDFVNPERSMSYNPLDYIRETHNTDGTVRYNSRDIVSLAHTLCPLHNRRDPFWEQSAQTVLTFLIAFVKESLEPRDHNMLSVLEVFRLLKDPECDKLERWVVTHPDAFATRKYEMFRPVMEVEKTWGCISQFVSEALDVFDMDEMRTIYGPQPFYYKRVNLYSIGTKKTAVFLNVSDTDRYADKLVNIFYTQALQILCRQADNRKDGRLAIPVRFILDDFASNAYIEDFDKIISVIRSRNIAVSVILQSLTQLTGMYSHDHAETIISNCDHMLYLGGQDLKTAEYIGTRCGRTPDKILYLPMNKAYLITRGQKGELVDKIVPYAEGDRHEAAQSQTEAGCDCAEVPFPM